MLLPIKGEACVRTRLWEDAKMVVVDEDTLVVPLPSLSGGVALLSFPHPCPWLWLEF